MFKKIFITNLSFFSPMFVFAVANTGIVGSNGILTVISKILKALIPILISIAVIVFIVGVIQYVLSAKPDDKAKGQGTMIYGVIGLFAIVAVWGLVAILTSTFGVATGPLPADQMPSF